MTPLDFSHLSLRDLVSLDACTRCGECIPVCPIVGAGEDHATAFVKIDQLQREWRRQDGGMLGPLGRLLGRGRRVDPQDMAAASYDCTLCGHCAQVCPVHIDTHHLWLSQRRQLAAADLAPGNLQATAATVARTGNIGGRPAEDRMAWLANVDATGDLAPRGADVLLFVGCLSSLYPQAFALPRALLTLLQGLGLRVGVLGPEEVCCGFPLYIGGRADEAVALARRNVEAIRASGAPLVVTSCPSCYQTLRHWYPDWLGEPLGPRVVHAVELLAERADGLRPAARPLRVTYHDPCDLGRRQGIYELPRDLLRRVPGLELVEMAANRENALCCGGGGDVEMARPELAQAMADRRFAQALETGAEAIVTACPQCTRALNAAARRARRRVPTYDLAEMLTAPPEH